MAHLWVRRGDEWVVERLTDDWASLTPLQVRDRTYRFDEPDPDATTAALMRVTGTQGEAWILMAGRDARVRVNGLPAAGGLRLLGDRDEILVDGVRRYFSTERLAEVEPFSGGAPGAVCPRCRQAIPIGARAVRCPGCQVWHHHEDSLPCWTYADTCAVCPQPTDLASGYRWTPEVDGL